MPINLRSCLSAGVILVCAALPSVAAPYGNLPLSFEANEGQVDKSVKFLSRGQGYTLFLTPSEAVLSLSGPRRSATVVRMRVAGGKRAPRLVGLDRQATKSNYFLGNDSRQWRTGVSHYAGVRYEDVYPGIDLVYRGNQRQLEYDFVIAPGADPKRIRLAFQGAGPVTPGIRGELVVHTKQGVLVQQAPMVYQETGGKRQAVEGRYVLRSGHRIGFAVGRYDRGRPLIIDPVLAYSTFLGGSGPDASNAVAVDAAGNTYVAGYTLSPDFPGAAGSSIQPARAGTVDAFVTKINAAGTAILYSTYLGGSGDDFGNDLAIDGMGNAYITGSTSSAAFPGVGGGSIQPANGGLLDAFVTKINATGTAILYSTFLGGSASDIGHGIAVDGTGDAYVAGRTLSTTFPGVSGGSIQPAYGGGDTYDAFVTKINPAGTAIVYSTYLGGGSFDYPDDIAVDGAGAAYVAGSTSSPSFPGVGGSSVQPAFGGSADAFVTKINPAGTAIVYSTYLGGSGAEEGLGIAVDSAGNAYVTGMTNSTTFPGVGGGSAQPANAGDYDAFVTKINPAGTATVYSTFLGGSGTDEGQSIAVDGTGHAYVAGDTRSTTFPGVSGASIQPTFGGGGFDGFVTKLGAAGISIDFSTFLGGGDGDTASSIALDALGNAYVTGPTSSLTFPGVDGGSLQPANADGRDSFLAKISDPKLSFHTVTPCRLVDTRDALGPLGGPALQPGGVRVFVVTGLCGVPATAEALSVNLTVTQPAAAGDLRLLPGDQPILPLVSTINFSPGQTRANNAVVLLAGDGSGGLQVKTDSAGSVHLILDVNGYFE